MHSISDYANAGQCAETLMVLLPGAYHGPADFEREGFVKAVRDRSLPMDITLAELAFDHVADLRAVRELHADVVIPAQASGYCDIWLVGISIGGYIGMAYAQQYPLVLHGLLLIAPYPGNRMTTNEIAAAGDIHAWAPPHIAADDTERRNWHWLKTLDAATLEVHLAYGEQDRFAASHALMAQALPSTQVDHAAGGHDWPAWYTLWCNFLDRRFGPAAYV